MKFWNEEAIILDIRDLGDQDRIVTFLSRNHGLKKGVAKAAKKRFSRFLGRLQLLAMVKISWYQKEDRDLGRISEVSLERSVDALRELEDLLLLSYIAEHFTAFATESEGEEKLYRLLDSTIKALLTGVPRALAARYVEAWVLRLTGIFPPPVECPVCGKDLNYRAAIPRDGEVILCLDCARQEGRGELLGREELEFLHHLGGESLMKLAQRKTPKGVLVRVERVFRILRRNFLQGELRSFWVLKETLPDGF